MWRSTLPLPKSKSPQSTSINSATAITIQNQPSWISMPLTSAAKSLPRTTGKTWSADPKLSSSMQTAWAKSLKSIKSRRKWRVRATLSAQRSETASSSLIPGPYSESKTAEMQIGSLFRRELLNLLTSIMLCPCSVPNFRPGITWMTFLTMCSTAKSTCTSLSKETIWTWILFTNKVKKYRTKLS